MADTFTYREERPQLEVDIELLEAFSERRTICPETAIWLREQIPILWRHLGSLQMLLLPEMDEWKEPVPACFKLAQKTYRGTLSGERPEEFTELWKRTGIPESIWRKLCEDWDGPRDQFHVWLEFNRAVENHFVFSWSNESKACLDNPFIGVTVVHPKGE